MTETNTSQEHSCTNENCTVSDTGVCILNHEDFINDCPDYSVSNSKPDIPPTGLAENVLEEEISPSIEELSLERQFWPGNEMGRTEVEELMLCTYGYLIGLIGLSGVGKTCFLISLYLKACSEHFPLKNFCFAGSKTLPGLEERSIRTREWEDGKIPDQLADHTILQDPRQPGFIHFEFVAKNNRKNKYNLLFTDLPGEWFRKLIIDSTDGDRLQFLKRADGLILFIDGEKLNDPSKKHMELDQAGTLIRRLKETIGIKEGTPLEIVVSKADVFGKKLKDGVDISRVEDIKAQAIRHGFNTRLSYIASFSRCPDQIENGYGIEESINSILQRDMVNATSAYHSFPKYESALISSFPKYQGAPNRKLRSNSCDE
jgi:bifunctional DNA-binding transcriptional regulator/antitoxin component of YhaV-PrlF toxin-antitoxin module